MKSLIIFFVFLSSICSAQTIKYDLVTIITIDDSNFKTDSLYVEDGKFIFNKNEIVQIHNSVEVGYPILSSSLEKGKMCFNTTNKNHEYILITSDNFIGGSINVATLKDDKTLILSYFIKCIE